MRFLKGFVWSTITMGSILFATRVDADSPVRLLGLFALAACLTVATDKMWPHKAAQTAMKRQPAPASPVVVRENHVVECGAPFRSYEFTYTCVKPAGHEGAHDD